MALQDWLLPTASPERFARRVIRAIRRAGLGDKTQICMKGERLSGPDGDGGRINLDNLYLDYRGLPRGQRGQVIDRVVQMVRRSGEPQETPADARQRLLPMVRDSLFFALLDPLGTHEHPSKRPVERPINDELTCGLCIDHDEAIATVNADELAKLGLTEDDAYRLALDNLRGRSDAPIVEAGPGLFITQYGDYHDAARLMMPELFARLGVRGDVIACVPNRTVVLACGSSDGATLAKLCGIATEQLMTQPRPMSGALFRLDNFEWRPWLPPRASEAYVAARDLATVGRASQYDGQRTSLIAALERAKIDRFVASFSTMSKKGGGEPQVSFCVWPPNVTDGSLPVTDVVAVGDDPKAALFALWTDAVRVAGHRLSPDPCGLPPRWLFSTSPTAEEIEAMGASDLDAAIARLLAND